MRSVMFVIAVGSLISALVLVTPLLGGALLTRSRHREEFIVLPAPPSDDEDTIELHSVPVRECLGGYVASESELFFRDDPLGAHSLPDVLEHHEIADAVLVELVNAGVLPSTPATYDTSWTPWGYELDDADERRLTLELEMDLVSLELEPTPVG